MELVIEKGSTEKALALAGTALLLFSGMAAIQSLPVTPAGFEPGRTSGSVSLTLDLSASLPTAPETGADSLAQSSAASEASQAARQVESPTNLSTKPAEELAETHPVETTPDFIVPPVLSDAPAPVEEMALPPLEQAPVSQQQPAHQATAAPRPQPRPDRVKPAPRPVNRTVRETMEPARVPEPIREPSHAPQVSPSDGQKAHNAEASDGVGETAVRSQSNISQSTGDSHVQRAAREAKRQGGRRASGDYWAAVARRLAELKVYPRKARSRRIEGTVILSLTLNADGSVAGFEILESAGSRLLDAATLKMVKTAGHFPPFPAGIGEKQMTRRIPVRFFLH